MRRFTAAVFGRPITHKQGVKRMEPSWNAQLQQLLDREAIRDCIYRFCRGVDRVDEDALRSVYWHDATGRHGAHQGDAASFIEGVLRNRKGGGRAIHLIGNILIEWHGDVAAVESYFRTTLDARDAGNRPQETLLAGRYLDRFERRNSEWRIAVRTVVYDWVRHTELKADTDAERFGSRQPMGAHKPADALYDLLAQAKSAD
jgi:ketosteroid isomerase-like protein